MTQGRGNPFGRASAPWMPETKLRFLANARRTYDEIALANERSEGWKPSRSAVKRKLESMGITRHDSHRELLPWKIRPEHQGSLWRRMLEAESRARKHGREQISDTDRKLVARLDDLLFGRGKPMVVGYHPAVGFYCTFRTEEEDIIRTAPLDFSDGIEQAIWDASDMSEPDRLTLIGVVRTQRATYRSVHAKTG